MEYYLRKAVLEPAPEIEISIEEFNDLNIARRVLSNAFEIEQKYEIVISNFLELEKELLNIAAANTVRMLQTYSEFFETISVLNTRLVNLLTATRLYFDQLPNHLRNCETNHNDFINNFKLKCSVEYDNHFEYRFMEALRNHVQHHGMPIHHISQDSRWTSFDDQGLMEYSVHLFAKLKDLEENKKFKKSVLKEISGDVNLIAATRQYLESISSINESVRELISDSLYSARASIELAHKRYAEIHSESLIGLSAIEKKDSKIISSVSLLLDWDDVRIKLQKRNPKLVNFSKRYVTTRIK
jgi:hypothetical protein